MHMSRPRTRTNAALAAAGGAGATATGPRPCTPEEMSRLQQQHGRQQRSHYNAWDPVLGFRASAGLPPVPCVPIGPAMPAPAAAPHAQPAAGAAGRHNAANGQRRDSESGFSFFRWGR